MKVKKDWAIKAIKIAVSIFLIIILIRRIDYSEFINATNRIRIDGVLVMVFVYFISTFLNAVKWRVLLPDTEIGFLTGLCFRAQFYSVVLPGQMFGEASKVASWSNRKEDVSIVAASVIFDKITGIIGQIMIGVFGIFLSSKASEIENKWILILMLVIGMLLMFVSSSDIVSSAIRKCITFVGRINMGLERKGGEFYDTWCLFSRDGSILIKSVIWGMINQAISILSVWYMSMRMGLDVGIVEYCWIMPLMSVILLLPISFAGVGLRDASMASMLSLLNVSTENSLIITSSMLMAQIVSAGVGGIYVLRSNISANKLEGDKSENDR